MEQFIQQFIQNLPYAGVFIFLYFKTMKDLSAKIDEKDKYIKEINEKLMILLENNTRVVQDVRNSTENNTKAIDKLSERINVFFSKME